MHSFACIYMFMQTANTTIKHESVRKQKEKRWYVQGATGSGMIHSRLSAAFAASNDRRRPSSYGAMRYAHGDLSVRPDQDSNHLLPQAHPAPSVACLASAKDACRTPNGLMFHSKHSRDDGPGSGLVDTYCVNYISTWMCTHYNRELDQSEL